jgi:hypothetical protein
MMLAGQASIIHCDQDLTQLTPPNQVKKHGNFSMLFLASQKLSPLLIAEFDFKQMKTKLAFNRAMHHFLGLRKHHSINGLY